MTKERLIELLRNSYLWGRENGSNRSELNFNDWLDNHNMDEIIASQEEEKPKEEKELKNPYCRLDLLEFNCGREWPCVQCDCFIENPELNKRLK